MSKLLDYSELLCSGTFGATKCVSDMIEELRTGDVVDRRSAPSPP